MPVGYVPPLGVHEWNRSQSGMSLLDYFAAHAPVQLREDTSSAWVSEITGISVPTNLDDQREWARFWAACEARLRYEYARAMLSAREAKQPEQTGGLS
jgi:hypothetical protein